MSKVIFLDIDGTLMDFGGGLTERTKEALLLAKAAGHILILCTGRTRCQISEELAKMPFSGIVAAAGAYIEYEGRELYHITVEEEKLSGLVSVFREKKVPLMLMGKDTLYGTAEDLEKIRKAILEAWENISAADPLDEIGRIEVLEEGKPLPLVEKTLFEASPVSLEEIKGLAGSYFDLVPSSFQREGSYRGELTVHGVTKASGIERVLSYTGKSREDTIAFGDSYNDLEMLSYVQVGVAMGNAPEAVKEAADMVTDDVKEDGLYNGFLKLGLL